MLVEQRKTEALHTEVQLQALLLEYLKKKDIKLIA